MKKKIILSVFIVACIIAAISISTETKSFVSKTDLPDWAVTVHHENGQGVVSGASVYIKLDGVNQFDSPKTSNSSGIAWFENNGSSFPNGHYEVRVVRTGFGDGVSYVDIINGAPVYPRTDSNSGPAL